VVLIELTILPTSVICWLKAPTLLFLRISYSYSVTSARIAEPRSGLQMYPDPKFCRGAPVAMQSYMQLMCQVNVCSSITDGQRRRTGVLYCTSSSCMCGHCPAGRPVYVRTRYTCTSHKTL